MREYTESEVKRIRSRSIWIKQQDRRRVIPHWMVREAVKRSKKGETITAIADEFGVSADGLRQRVSRRRALTDPLVLGSL